MLHIEWESDVSSPNGMDVENVNKPVKYQQLPERTVVVGDAPTAEKFSTPDHTRHFIIHLRSSLTWNKPIAC
jgi:hypothetical protein